jgi:hypothetical protein
MRNRIKYFFLAVLLFYSVDLAGTLLLVKDRFGTAELILPRQIIICSDEIFILDEYAPLKPGDEKIKVFSLDGTFKTEFGRGGEGPGEFGEASAFYIFKQKVFILDSIKRQLHVFSVKDKKHIESNKIYSGNPGTPYTTTDDFFISSDRTAYTNAGRNIEGQKIITRLKLNGEIKPVNSFLNCIPLYKDLRESIQTDWNKPDNVRKSYINIGYVAGAGDKIYFTYWLLNRVYELSPDGEILNQYILPLESIDKNVKVVKVGRFYNIEKKLNYDLLTHKDRVYVLSRDKNGDSIIFKLENGRFLEKYRMKERLFSFDINDHRLYGIERDEAQVFVYDLE